MLEFPHCRSYRERWPSSALCAGRDCLMCLFSSGNGPRGGWNAAMGPGAIRVSISLPCRLCTDGRALRSIRAFAQLVKTLTGVLWSVV